MRLGRFWLSVCGETHPSERSEQKPGNESVTIAVARFSRFLQKDPGAPIILESSDAVAIAVKSPSLAKGRSSWATGGQTIRFGGN
jgi:hypothetical protein